MAKILLVEDDATFSQILQGFLPRNGHEVSAVNNIKNGLRQLDDEKFDMLLLDYRLPDGTGLEVMAYAHDKGLKIPAVMMTSFNDVRTAVKAIQAGASDYITKPVNPDELLMILKSALTAKSDEQKADTVKADKPAAAATTTSYPGFIKGTSSESDKLYEYIDLVAPTDMSVVIQGESGTGKEHAARFIHERSKRADKPFIAIDCGALSKDLAASELFGHIKGAFTGALADKKGLFEVADGGTLFMDEIGNLSYDVQVKLLRALQENTIQPLGSTKQIKVDVRIIAATNDDLLSSVSNGDFRQDLYHRINEFKIQIPALRERGKDLQLFISHFINISNQELERNVKSISPEGMELLTRYDWPGNLRELKNVIKRMVLLTRGEEAGAESLPDEMRTYITHLPTVPADADLKALNEANERTVIQQTLQKVKYNKSKAAKLLNIDRKTLYAKIERYGLDS
ncbi:sigma-54 dependent transcriptional regulator [Mucilaginibacter sp. UR6-1]|uniref:sigma-54-dependent transcriptional regulator n=1 Tax=Mucilaginibacter sp. UR6-1 TaxID=1435643 RepID=UPI001E4720FA|nr:sigma-54 dependent transcriptional regulator [Mucilaginibacter sp. UR6-1]MCC8409252.1 sigma-54 dependent transcriptional regulator [Mucilaginibacter sp. UR6-1]